ncbi:nucleotidyl transferase AbiEii/AbiGii toxin family protein [Streptomyces mirabilis]|uniref:nucleotidyl transferase AbiEii/AbiGii toxin family protein n=1 Tax=Streptomyces mirabilis TaxID=68239 RepID=UPI00367EF815
MAADPTSGHACEVDVLKEALWRPPVVLDVGPVLAPEDLIGTKVRALADRGLPRDFIDVHAARDSGTGTASSPSCSTPSCETRGSGSCSAASRCRE